MRVLFDRGVQFPLVPRIIEHPPLFVPQGIEQHFFQGLVFLAVFFGIVARDPAQFLHGFERFEIDDLFCGDFAAVVDIRPVDEHPVALFALDHAAFRLARARKFDDAPRGGDHAAQIIFVACVHIKIVQPDDPVKRVFHDMVHEMHHGRLTRERRDRAAFGFQIEKGIIVHQKRLIGVARPQPAVALDAVEEKFAGIERQRIQRHRVNFFQFFIRTGKFCAPRLRHEFAQYFQVGQIDSLAVQMDVAERLADFGARLYGKIQFVRQFAILFVRRLRKAFAVPDMYKPFALARFQIHHAHHLAAAVEKKRISILLQKIEIYFFITETKRPRRRFGIGQPVAPRRRIPKIVGSGEKLLVRAHRFAVDVQRGNFFFVIYGNDQFVFARPKIHKTLKFAYVSVFGRLYPIHDHVELSVCANFQPLGLRKRKAPYKFHVFTKIVRMPEGRHEHLPFVAGSQARIELPYLVIAVMPYPFCLSIHQSFSVLRTAAIRSVFREHDRSAVDFHFHRLAFRK